MRPLAALSSGEARALRVVLFDLDDTVLDGGHLGEDAYRALFRLRESGLGLVAVTGRPKGWAELVARQWPVDGAIAENGAVACALSTGRLETIDFAAGDRERRRTLLAEAVAEVARGFPELRPTDDVGARVSDYTFDIGEYDHVAPETVLRARAAAHALGVRTVASSVHLHLTLDGLDKAAGAVRFLERRFEMDRTVARHVAAFVGDSENDAPCFAAFVTTFAVANLSGSFTVMPRFVATKERGAGFAEIAGVIVARRGGTSAP